MERNQPHPPVILLLEKEKENARGTLLKWLEESGFLTCEALDVFDALEEISDFTVRTRPDVILLNVESSRADFPLVREMVCSSAGDPELPIVAFSENGRSERTDGCFEGNISQLAARLETLIPREISSYN